MDGYEQILKMRDNMGPVESTFAQAVDPTAHSDDRQAHSGILIAYAAEIGVQASNVASDPNMTSNFVEEAAWMATSAWSMAARAVQVTR